jgi:tRNA threonylcarbamoyladenosine biosynthesis protein TsaB
VTSKILALDTTNEFGSLALVRGDEVVAELPMHSAEGFGHLLFGRIAAILKNAGWNLAEIDCFAAAAGPGSFTGVRVGLSAAKGLAEALGKPAAAVSNLEAIAWHGTARLRAAVIDARRGQIYGAVYDSGLGEVSPETVAAFPAWLATLPEGDLQFLSTDCSVFRAALAGTRFEKSPVLDVPRALAGAIGCIAAGRLRAGETGDPAALDANYVRRSDAELFWRE